MNVLVIDDDRDARAIMSEALGHWTSDNDRRERGRPRNSGMTRLKRLDCEVEESCRLRFWL